MAWIKGNVLIVIFIAIILAVLPASYVMSAAWGASIRNDQANKAGEKLKAVNGASVDYSIPQYDPSAQAVTFKAAPNAALTKWFKEEREKFATAAGAIVKKAEDFNKGVGEDAKAVGRREHRPIVDGLFPGASAQAEAQLKAEAGGDEKWNELPEDDRKARIASRAKQLVQDKLYEAEDAFLGRRGRPNPYQSLLNEIGAGGPTDPIRLLDEVNGLRTNEIQKIGVKRELTQKEAEDLLKLLQERRLGAYQARARDVSVYATMSIYPTNDKLGSAVRLDSFEAAEVDPYYFFAYQWDLWLLSDMLSAVRLANTGPNGERLPVEQAVVKRILSITMQEPKGYFENVNDTYGGGFEQVAQPTASVPGMVPTDPKFSITGRGMGSWNTVYDLRHSTMTCVVSSARLGEFLDAIERTNFMTVTGLEVSGVNVWSDLREGYYYGPEHVVKVKVDIESVWLRSWMTAYMPDRVKTVLGIGGGDGAAAPAAPVAPMAPSTPKGGGRGNLKGRG
jgi:hypothetical protein